VQLVGAFSRQREQIRQDPRPGKRRARGYSARHVKQQAATGRIRKHSPQTISQEEESAQRGRRGQGVIEEDSIFPCRHRGFVSPWLRLQSCGLLSFFFMFSLFDVVSLGGLLIQSSSSVLARAILFAARIILQIFPLFRALGFSERSARRRAVRAFRPSLM